MQKHPRTGPRILGFMTNMDWSSRTGAHALSEHIRNYWIEKGYPEIKTEVVLVRQHSDLPEQAKDLGTFGVRSNMINGFPPKNTL